MNVHDVHPLAAEFQQLWDFARQATVPMQQHQGAIHRLPPSLRSVAEIVEESDAYRQFVKAPLWGPKPPGTWRFREALRRAGFYHAIQSGTEPKPVWDSLLLRLKPHVVNFQTLVLLDGCSFSINRFSVAQTWIQRFSIDELKTLGPPDEIASVFFQTEILNSSWYKQVWFLVIGGQREVKPCSAPGFLDSGLTVFASTLPRPARRGHVAPERDFDSGISPASTARCTFA